MSILPD